MGEGDRAGAADEVVVVRYALTTMWVSILAGLAAVLYASFAIFRFHAYGILPPTRGHSVFRAYALACCGLFFLVIGVRRFFDDAPQMILRADGLMVRKRGLEFVPWNEVARIERYVTSRNWFAKHEGIRVEYRQPRPGYGLLSVQVAFGPYEPGIDKVMDAFRRFAPQIVSDSASNN